jgi:CheY-like chemotaxis protein
MKVPLRILHVDDNPIDVRLAQAFLSVSGTSVTSSVSTRRRLSKTPFSNVGLI